MKILITGIAGFVGSTISRKFIEDKLDCQIYGIDNLSFGYKFRISDFVDKINFFEGDILNIEKLIGRRKFDLVIHCAAIAPLPECQINSYRAIDQNVSITGRLIDYCLKYGSRNLIFFSSAAIYENVKVFPSHEAVKINTSLIYPATKYMCEIFLNTISKSHEINITSLRLFNLYGPNQDYFRKQPPLIGYLLKSVIENKKAYLYSTGSQSRDYIYIDDLYDLINLSFKRMINLKKNGTHLILNAGSGKTYSVNDIVKEISKITGKKIHVEKKPAVEYWNKYSELYDRKIPLNGNIVEKEVNKYTESSDLKAKKQFNWKCKISLTEGLTECYKFARKII